MRILIFLMIMFSFSSMNAQESIYEIKIKNIDGNYIDFNSFRGKKLLFVNVASECGFTSQYTALEQLQRKYKDELIVIGVPCNQFGGQEPGSTEQIKNFCRNEYNVSFLLTEKVKVKGKDAHPLYKWLTDRSKNGKSGSSVKWNFQKYLVDEKGDLIDYFLSTTRPLSPKIIKLIEQ